MTAGQLFIVSTPLGHLDDLSPRAVTTLRSVDLIAAEDTRHTAKLLRHFDVSTPCISCHDHNETDRIELITGRLINGESIALVSDAGTPLISDPGYKLVRAVAQAGVRVVPIPGPCALTTALVVSGLPSDRFSFFGFAPSNASTRLQWFQSICSEAVQGGTFIFYESKHRLIASLRAMLSVFGNVEACVARELTKEFESVYRGHLEDLIEQLEAFIPLRGEFVVLLAYEPLVVESQDLAECSITLTAQELHRLVSAQPHKKQLAQFLGSRSDVATQVWYKWLARETE